MTAFAGSATYDSYKLTSELASVAAVIGPKKTPFLDSIGAFPGGTCTKAKYDYKDFFMHYGSATLGEDLDNSETGVDVSTGHGARFLASMIVLVDEEMMSVDSTPGADTVTVTRGVCGTSAATHTSGATIYIISRPALEGADWSHDAPRTPVDRTNYTQIFSRDYEISGSDLAQEQDQLPGGTKSIRAFFEEQCLSEVLRDIERAAMLGRVQGSSPRGSSTVPRTMAGVASFAGSISATAAGSATFSKTYHVDAIQRTLYNEGNDPDLLIASADVMEKLSAVLSTYKMATMDGTTLNAQITNYINAVGTNSRLITSPHLPPGQLVVASSPKIALLWLRRIQGSPLVQTGDKYSGKVLAECTMRVEGGASAHYRVYSIS